MKKRVYAAPLMLTIILCSAQFAYADSDGYIDNWIGQLYLAYSFKGNAPFIVPVSPVDLRQAFQDAWAKADGPGTLSAKDQVCDNLRNNIEHAKWISCAVASSGELRGKNDVGAALTYIDLRYVIKNNSMSFTVPTDSVFGSAFDPTVQATFDVKIDIALAFDSDVDDGTNPSRQNTMRPARVLSAKIGFANAHFTADVVVVDFGLRDAEARLNGTSRDLPDYSFVAKLNDQLHMAVPKLADSLKKGLFGGLPGATNYFSLKVFIDDKNKIFGNDKYLIALFGKEGSAPTPPINCKFFEQCDAGFGPGFVMDCDPVTGALSYSLVGTENTGSNLTFVDIEYSPPQTLPEVGTVLPQGDHSGDFRMCAASQWGKTCSDTLHVQITHIQKCGDPHGGGTDTGWFCPPLQLWKGCHKVPTVPQ